MKTNAKIIIVAGISGFLAVLIGALGAHALSGLDDASEHAFETASEYHFYHTLALLFTGLAGNEKKWNWIRGFFLAGIILFCGGIYLSVFSGISTFTKVTPLGGMSFMTGWILLVWTALKQEG